MKEMKSDQSHIVENHWESIQKLFQFLWTKNNFSRNARVVFALCFLILAKIISVYTPFIYRDMINHIEANDTSERQFIYGLIFAFGLAKLMQTVFGELRDLIFIKVSQEARRNIGLKTFKHLHNLSLKFHLERQTGGLSRVIERGTSGIQFILSFMLFNIIPTFLELVFITILLLYNFGYMYSLIILFTISAYILLTLYITEWRLKFRREMNQKDEQANTKAIDSLLNFETVKYFNNEEHEYKRFNKALLGYEQSAIKSQFSLTLLNICQSAIISLGTIFILYLAYNGVCDKKINIGEFVMINTYMMQLFLPLNFLGFVYRQMKQSLIDMDRMFYLNKQSPEIKDHQHASELKSVKGHIVFENISFQYGTESRCILNNFSLEVKSGETVAIVGESGSGKSTLVRLLYRFYDVTEGSIKIDDHDIRKIYLNDLRKNIGVVPQDTVLFNDTINYNIQYGNPSADSDLVNKSIESAKLKDFISKTEQGLLTKVGERGLKVSGGEKQRIAIARTLLKNPPILILDEATSALDSKTEKEIESSLDQLAKDRTTIIIAHRLSTIINSDNIVVLKNGSIYEQGTHKFLLEKKGEYYEMWQRQKEIKNYKEKLKKITPESIG